MGGRKIEQNRGTQTKDHLPHIRFSMYRLIDGTPVEEPRIAMPYEQDQCISLAKGKNFVGKS
jgi:hypothetical protein